MSHWPIGVDKELCLTLEDCHNILSIPQTPEDIIFSVHR